MLRAPRGRARPDGLRSEVRPEFGPGRNVSRPARPGYCPRPAFSSDMWGPRSRKWRFFTGVMAPPEGGRVKPLHRASGHRNARRVRELRAACFAFQKNQRPGGTKKQILPPSSLRFVRVWLYDDVVHSTSMDSLGLGPGRKPAPTDETQHVQKPGAIAHVQETLCRQSFV